MGTLTWKDQKVSLHPITMPYREWYSLMAHEFVTAVRYSVADGWEIFVGEWGPVPGEMTLDEAKALAIVLNRMRS